MRIESKMQINFNKTSKLYHALQTRMISFSLSFSKIFKMHVSSQRYKVYNHDFRAFQLFINLMQIKNYFNTHASEILAILEAYYK